MEELAPPSLQESYDNSGLLVGDAQTEVKGILVSLDCTEDVVDDAISQGCNLIVSHHPIVFSGLKRFNGKNYIERTVIKAIKNDVLLYAIHTNLDNVLDGVNQKIAERIGLVNTKVLAPKKERLKKVVTYCPTDMPRKCERRCVMQVQGTLATTSARSTQMELVRSEEIRTRILS